MTTGSMTHVRSGSVNPYSDVQPTSLRVHGVCIELPRDNVWDAMTPVDWSYLMLCLIVAYNAEAANVSCGPSKNKVCRIKFSRHAYITKRPRLEGECEI
jgi:hypothetical protein